MKRSCSTLLSKKDIQCIAIGVFDGMHIAHQKLFEKLDKNGAIVAIETGCSNLTPKKFRQEFTNLTIYYYLLDYIKHLDGKEFIKLIKKEFPNLKKIVVGFDFCFGKNRQYCVKDLKQLFKGEVITIKEVKKDNIPIHSKCIREFIKNGKIQKANEFLGKNYKIIGSQIKGQGLGKKKFVPTINVEVKDFLLPSQGVYITKTKIKDFLYNSITFLGKRVTTDKNFCIETHILNKNIQGTYKRVEIEFLSKLRENKKFNSFEELKFQIDMDIKKAKEFFNNY